MQEVKADSPERDMLKALALTLYKARSVEVVRLRTWLNLQPPDPGEGYSDGYPHVHTNNDGKTFVFYLSDNPSPLDILEDGEVVMTLKPEAGDVAYIPNGVWHAAHRNPGPSDRIALITTGYSF